MTILLDDSEKRTSCSSADDVVISIPCENEHVAVGNSAAESTTSRITGSRVGPTVASVTASSSSSSITESAAAENFHASDNDESKTDDDDENDIPVDTNSNYPSDSQQQHHHHGNDNADNDDDQSHHSNVTFIDLDPQTTDVAFGNFSMDWLEQQGPELELRRRTVLLRELQRVQRASCLHFSFLCLIPFSLLLVVLSAVLRSEESCDDSTTTSAVCELEPRSVMTAFTTRCVCDPIDVLRSSLGEGP